MVLRTVVAPLLSAYLLFLAMLAYAVRHPAPRPGRSGGSRNPAWGRLLRHLAATGAGGYAFFLLVVLVFHVALAGQRAALASAAAGGAFLAFGVASPLFLLLHGIGVRRRR
ncbi:MAG: hypothetical protein HYU54_08280 [Actinobacteria bacterium]|nr:hypothetical protein [Actinomycetota bacterium]